MTLTEAREVVEKLKHPGSVIYLDDPRHADEYIGRCKVFLEGHKAALETVREHIFDACKDKASVCADCSDNMLFIDKLMEAQK